MQHTHKVEDVKCKLYPQNVILAYVLSLSYWHIDFSQQHSDVVSSYLPGHFLTLDKDSQAPVLSLDHFKFLKAINFRPVPVVSK